MNFRSYYFYSLFFTCILFSQNEYKFDTFSKISNTNSSRENESTYLINSSDDSYFMEIYSHSDSTFSRIYDSGNLVSHYFYLDKSDSLKLNFIKTFKFKKYDKFKKKEKIYKFLDLKEENGLKSGIFKVSNSRGRKLAKFEIKFKKTKKNYFSLFSFFVLESRYSNLIYPPHNLLVLEAKGKNESGNYIYYRLMSIHDINLIVKIKN